MFTQDLRSCFAFEAHAPVLPAAINKDNLKRKVLEKVLPSYFHQALAQISWQARSQEGSEGSNDPPQVVGDPHFAQPSFSAESLRACQHSMSEERLSSLTLIRTHYDTPVDLKEAVNIFARIHPRRLELDNIL